jgi:hypothetical protein
MQMVSGAERFVIARENNVVRVDFRRSDPPAPDFPGAGGMRVLFDMLDGDGEVGRKSEASVGTSQNCSRAQG